MTTQETIDQAARIIREREQRKYDEGSSPVFIGGAACRDIAQVLADAGLLGDPTEHAELERWRAGLRRKSWPQHSDAPDAMRTAASLARAQAGEDEALDSLLREGAVTIKALREGYGYAVAQRDAALATIQRVRDLHQLHPTNCSCHARRWDGSCFYAGTCNSCHCGMPCPTVRALDQEASE